MSELGEKLWAVISERGCEALGLSYTEAAQLMRKLSEERVRGLCVISEGAARRLSPAGPTQSSEPSTEASPATR